MINRSSNLSLVTMSKTSHQTDRFSIRMSIYLVSPPFFSPQRPSLHEENHLLDFLLSNHHPPTKPPVLSLPTYSIYLLRVPTSNNNEERSQLLANFLRYKFRIIPPGTNENEIMKTATPMKIHHPGYVAL